ncbi:hypothetical protein [Bradyrhizobium sp.]|uniref:hypothetical protein n=1 Tax=Bradyrhizobium sp. TaxID=376 RepID=UPI003C7313D0
MSKILMTMLFGLSALSFVAAPVTIDLASGKIGVKSAMAKHGADDIVPDPFDDNGVDPQPHR